MNLSAPPAPPLRPYLVAAVAAFAMLATSAAWIGIAYRGNVTGVFRFGDRFGIPREVRAAYPDIIVLPKSDGYDGQFYFLVALAPFDPARHAASFGPDNIKYRFGRIVWPALAHLTALGSVAVVPWSLIGWNALFFGVAVGAAGRLLQRFDRSAWWALLLCGAAGFQIATARMMNDAAPTAFVALAILAHVDGRAWRAAGWLALAALAREASAIFVIALAASVAFEPWRPADAKEPQCEPARPGHSALRAVAILLLGVLPMLAWHAWVSARVDAAIPTPSAVAERLSLNFTLPLSGYLSGAKPLLAGLIESPLAPGKWLALLHRGVYLVAALLAFDLAWRRREFVSLAAAALACLLVVTSQEVWVEFWAYGHVFFLLSALVAVEYLRSGRCRFLVPFIGDVAFTLLFMARELARARAAWLP